MPLLTAHPLRDLPDRAQYPQSTTGPSALPLCVQRVLWFGFIQSSLGSDPGAVPTADPRSYLLTSRPKESLFQPSVDELFQRSYLHLD